MNFSYTEEDLITTDGYLDFCTQNNISYVKTDYFYSGSFHWRGKQHPTLPLGNVCVIGHSDYSITDKISDQFSKVFCTNRETEKINTYGLPLGISNYTDETPYHKICGNKSIFVSVNNSAIDKEVLAYINFTVSTYPNDRGLILEKFSKLDWTRVGKTETTESGNRKYLEDIKKSKFVFCPRGNGIDTHRLWESLYMGSIPIVKYENAHHLFKDLPILFINDWNQITRDFLNDKYDEISSMDWNFDKLKISYWKNFIKTHYDNN